MVWLQELPTYGRWTFRGLLTAARRRDREQVLESIHLSAKLASRMSRHVAATSTSYSARTGYQIASTNLIPQDGLNGSLERAPHDGNASLPALAFFIRVRVRKVHSEVGELDALGGKSDLSRGLTDPSDELLMLLLWPPSERLDGVQERAVNARFCEIGRASCRERVLDHV